ncbi:MAG: MFS transporter [Pseudomonadota bacterium]
MVLSAIWLPATISCGVDLNALYHLAMLHFVKQNFRWIGGGFLLTYCSSFGQTYFISGSIAEWQTMFDLTHGQIGRLYMFATLASAMALPFVGRLIDVWPVRRMVVVFMPVLAIASLLAASAWTVAILFVGIFLLRLAGQGMMTHIALTTTGRSFVAARGRAVSLVVLGHQGGEATLPIAFSLVAATYGFEYGWYASAAVLLVIGLPLAVWAFSIPREASAQFADDVALRGDVRQWTRREVARDPVFWVLLTCVLAPAFIGTTIFYHQDYLTALQGWPPTLFASSLILMAATTVVVALVFGQLIDRFGVVRLLPFFLLPLALACLVLSQAGAPWTLFVAIVLIGMSYGISSTLLGALWPEIYGTQHLGAVRSMIVSAMVLSTALGPGVTGTLIDHGIALPRQMVVMAGYCFVATIALQFVARALNRRQGATALDIAS